MYRFILRCFENNVSVQLENFGVAQLTWNCVRWYHNHASQDIGKRERESLSVDKGRRNEEGKNPQKNDSAVVLPLLMGIFRLCYTCHVFFLNFFSFFCLKKLNVLGFVLDVDTALHMKNILFETCWCFCPAIAYKSILSSPSLGRGFLFSSDWDWPGFTTLHSCSYHC